MAWSQHPIAGHCIVENWKRSHMHVRVWCAPIAQSLYSTVITTPSHITFVKLTSFLLLFLSQMHHLVPFFYLFIQCECLCSLLISCNGVANEKSCFGSNVMKSKRATKCPPFVLFCDERFFHQCVVAPCQWQLAFLQKWSPQIFSIQKDQVALAACLLDQNPMRQRGWRWHKKLRMKSKSL